MRRILFIGIMCVFFTTPAWADLISFADTIAGVDGSAPTYGGLVSWSAGDGMVDLNKQSYSLLGGMASVSAYKDTLNADLSHRGTRGLGVWGGENDEVDKHIIGINEHIDILFSTTPYYVHEIEVRSLFDPDTDNNEEWAAIAFWKDGILVQTEYLLGTEQLGGGADGDASWSGTPILVDKLVFYVPTRNELTNASMVFDTNGTTYYPSMSEFAVAKLTVTPVPGAAILGILGLVVAGLKLRRFA